jgi:hypothetical protein
VQYAEQVLWFTSLVSKASNLPGIEAALKKAGAKAVRMVEMGQGQKQSRMVAWSFQTTPRARPGTPSVNHRHEKPRPGKPGAVSSTLQQLLVDGVGQHFGWNELDDFLGSDFDGSASRRVAASTGRTLGDFQLADAWQSDFAAVFQLVGNDLAQLVQSVTRGGFRRVDSFSDVGNQLVFGQCHGGVPSLSNSYGLQRAVSAIGPAPIQRPRRSRM